MKNESLQPSGNGRDARASDTQKHNESLRRKPVSKGMDAVIRRLINSPQISRSALLELFEYRASFAAITAWRFGWRGPPQWAIDLIGDKLAARAARDAAELAKVKPTIGMGWNKGAKTLAAWRERKARERDEKEKAAHDDEREKAIWQQYAKTKWASEDGTTQGRDDDEKEKAATEAAAFNREPD